MLKFIFLVTSVFCSYSFAGTINSIECKQVKKSEVFSISLHNTSTAAKEVVAIVFPPDDIYIYDVKSVEEKTWGKEKNEFVEIKLQFVGPESLDGQDYTLNLDSKKSSTGKQYGLLWEENSTGKQPRQVVCLLDKK